MQVWGETGRCVYPGRGHARVAPRRDQSSGSVGGILADLCDVAKVATSFDATHAAVWADCTVTLVVGVLLACSQPSVNTPSLDVAWTLSFTSGGPVRSLSPNSCKKAWRTWRVLLALCPAR